MVIEKDRKGTAIIEIPGVPRVVAVTSLTDAGAAIFGAIHLIKLPSVDVFLLRTSQNMFEKRIENDTQNGAHGKRGVQ